MTNFPPIAIVGQGCALPGALTPEKLWEIVAAGEDALGTVPAEYWGVDPESVSTDADDPKPDATWTDRGGFVRGFDEVFDPTGFQLSEEQIAGLDPVFQWGLYAGREALRGTGHDLEDTTDRAGIILGNKSYPTRSLADFAEDVWREENGWETRHDVDPTNRFMSGLPAQLVAKALGLGGGSFCLDVACASSLYAIKLACDRLHRGDADLMLAGGINRADDLFLRIGFCALQAMSRTGQSRPFHRQADGLVPAEGAALVALKRLDDAVSDGDSILGVIRGVGLSNDGRSRGLLTPAREGQVRSMKRAYEGAGLAPSDLTMIECHAAGTALGDATEVQSMAEVFDDVDTQLPIASLKSNLGHLITVSGAAGLLKVVAAMEHEMHPPTLNADDPIDVLGESPFRLLHKAEEWTCDGPRRAAINNFGFGGNNAHLIVEQWDPDNTSVPVEAKLKPAADEAVAVVDISVVAADGEDRDDFARALLYGEPRLKSDDGKAGGRAEDIALDVGEVRFPPLDLKQALPQQLMILEATLQLGETIAELPGEDTGILLGMQCDAEIARYLVRWRLGQELVDRGGDHRDGLIEALEAAGVLGTMPNLVTNRLNSQFDLKGASLTLSGEELSGMIALDLACRALRNEELDAAVVGAVDLSCEPVQRAAAKAVLSEDRHTPGDAAVALVLKRLSDARRDGDEIHAVVPVEEDGDAQHQQIWEVPDLVPTFGHAHAATGLLHVAAAVEACSRRALPARQEQPPVPWLPDRGRRRAAVSMDTVTGETLQMELEAPPRESQRPLVETAPPTISVYGGASLDEVRRALESGQPVDGGPIRLAISYRGEEQGRRRHRQAEEALAEVDDATSFAKLGRGVYLGDGSLAEGETAFVFTGPAGSYNGMGRELVLAVPQLADAFAERCRAVDRAAGWIYRPPTGETPGPGKKLWGASFLCQIHAQLTRDVLGIEPEAAIGFCAGETNALFAMGAWNDFDGLYEDLEREEIFDRRLGGAFDTVRDAFDVDDSSDVQWQTWRLLAPLEVVEEAVDAEEQCYITIVNAPGDCVVGGRDDACARVIEKVGKKRARPLGYNIAMHCAATSPIEKLWHDMHHRPTEPVPGVRFYTHATLDHYEVDADKVADALVGQAMGRVDFPKLIRRAWDDGVRVFIEHGPRAGCTRWIGKILGDKEHVAVSLDRTGRDSLTRAVDTTARLYAAGVDVDHRRLTELLDDARALPAFDERKREKSGAALRFPAHLSPVKLPAKGAEKRQVEQESTAKPVQNGELRRGEKMILPPVLPGVFADTPSPAAPRREAASHRQPAKPSAEHRNRNTASEVVASDERTAMNGRAPAEQPRTLEGQMAALHSEFLRERAALHRDFMEQQQQQAQWFWEMYEQGESPDRVQRTLAARGPAPAPSGPPAPAAPAQDTAVGDDRQQDHRAAPLFDRDDLKIHASGAISEIFGPMFERQDDYPRQVRMPEPPLLLVDRVTDIDAEPGAMERQGVIWTETDVADDAWYLHRGRMPVGITVEAGQADLMLISWMGADFKNRGQRVYRLLGCELTFHGELPKPGETLEYEIHIDEHARQGDVRIFFFHYDCIIDGEVRLSMRNGQAGFFSDEELANSEGVLWTPDDMEAPTGPQADPVATPNQRNFGADQLRAFAAGRVVDCFGEGYERAAAHTETPAIQGDEMLFLDEVEVFDVDGGPHGRGYLRAVQNLSPDTWFFDGHFNNDPCMPGTLMLEGCTQAMSFYLAGLGYTLDRDGWRFEPATDEPCQMRCRGQVTPSSKQVVYELFVRDVVDGEMPTLYADLLCTVDGLKAFHCERLGLRLVPGWPLERHPEWIDAERADNASGRPAATVDGFSYDQAAVMACTLGKPSKAFGPMYRPFDGPRRAPRLPNPPYLFISRIADIDAEQGAMESGSKVVAEYDVPADAWYFDSGNSGAMPFCALMEVGLQPCGWLASYVGCALSADEELFFRNLDGTGTVFGEVTADTSLLRTESVLTSISRSGSMIIVGFDVDVYADGEPVFSMETVFGFFPAAALAQQDGLATTDEMRQRLDAPCDTALNAELPGLSDELAMFDRITGWWPEGGEAGLGKLRSEQDIDPSSWYFQSHFFQDPVQPGSLGVEAMLQLLQVYMLAAEMDTGIADPRFEPVLTDRATTWKYRGQVIPENEQVHLDLEITERSEPGVDNPYAIGRASLWVDGTRIYEVTDLGMRICAGEGETDEADGELVETTTLDPEVDTWLKDHRPTFTRPALPMMSIADYLADAVAANSADPVVELRDVHLQGWAVVDGATEVTAQVAPSGDGWWEAELSTPEKEVASGRARCADEWPKAPAPLGDLKSPQPMDDPYESGALFHGPAFQLLVDGEVGERGSRAVLDAGAGDVPVGAIHPALLDAALHVIPHDDLQTWSDDIAADTVAYPHRIDHLTLHGPTPEEGEIRVETRLVGFADSQRFPVFHIQFLDGDRVWADMHLVELLFPKGRIAQGDPGPRRAFLRDRQFVAGFGVSHFDGGETRLSVPEFRKNDWFEGTIAAIYGVDGDLVEQTRQVAIKDHLAQRLEVHPSQIEVDGTTATCGEYPGETFAVDVRNDEAMEFVVRD